MDRDLLSENLSSVVLNEKKREIFSGQTLEVGYVMHRDVDKCQ